MVTEAISFSGIAFFKFAASLFAACQVMTDNDNQDVDAESDKHSSVGKTYEIDQRAIKDFSSWLPDNWLARKQDPDFYIDYLVEIVENGEPTGKHFGVQIKGYEDTLNEPKPLSYSFKTKHLSYYLNCSQNPIFLLLINVTTHEGFWVFAQKFLKERVTKNILDEQKSLTIHFTTEDSLFNFAKFKCLLPEAEKFVRACLKNGERFSDNVIVLL